MLLHEMFIHTVAHRQPSLPECVLWGVIRLRARPSQDIRWPFNYSSGRGGKQQDEMTDGHFDFTYQGLGIQSTLRAPLANNRTVSGRLASIMGKKGV